MSPGLLGSANQGSRLIIKPRRTITFTNFKDEYKPPLSATACSVQKTNVS